jgi:hypothetical protein
MNFREARQNLLAVIAESPLRIARRSPEPRIDECAEGARVSSAVQACLRELMDLFSVVRNELFSMEFDAGRSDEYYLIKQQFDALGDLFSRLEWSGRAEMPSRWAFSRFDLDILQQSSFAPVRVWINNHIELLSGFVIQDQGLQNYSISASRLGCFATAQVSGVGLDGIGLGGIEPRRS